MLYIICVPYYQSVRPSVLPENPATKTSKVLVRVDDASNQEKMGSVDTGRPRFDPRSRHFSLYIIHYRGLDSICSDLVLRETTFVPKEYKNIEEISARAIIWAKYRVC